MIYYNLSSLIQFICRFSNQLDKLNLIITKNSSNEFDNYVNYASVIDILHITYYIDILYITSDGVTITFCKFWFENDTDTG